MSRTAEPRAGGPGAGWLGGPPALLLVFLATVALHLALHAGRSLYDTDAFVHLSMARLYAEQGIPDGLDAARFSVMHDGFGDKEWLFHGLLAAPATLFSPLVAGHVGLALLNGLLAVVLAGLGRRAIGPWGLALPLVLPLLSTEMAWRLVRLRPELLALPLLIAALALLALRRPRWLGLVVLVFTWSWTAFHALLGVIVLSWLALLVAERRRPDALDWRLLAYPMVGAGAGLVLHPHFPHNLVVWVVQNVQFFAARDILDVGTEILPNTTDVTLLANLGWWLALLVFWRSLVPGPPASAGDRRLAVCLGVGAAAFLLLYLLMSRFALFMVPLVTLAVLFEARRRGRRPSRRLRLPLAGSVPLAAGVAACALVALPGDLRQARTFAERTDLGADDARLREWAALSAAIPEGARVAADWRATGVLMLWAPQGRYLNVLDPVFMASLHPEAHAALRRILAGDEPDVPGVVTGVLDSDWLLVRTVGAAPDLLARLRADPRASIRFDGSYLLVRFDPAPDAFVADGWRAAGDTRPAQGAVSTRTGLPGYVDGRRWTSARGCIVVRRTLTVPEASEVALELTPAGPSALSVDGQVVGTVGGVGAVPGRGAMLRIAAEPGERRVDVRTCPGPDGNAGFYLRLVVGGA